MSPSFLRRQIGITFITAVIISTLALPWLSPIVSGVQSNLTQRIVPLHCVFDTVRDGDAITSYLTPEECGDIVTPPVVDPEENPTTPTQPTLPPVIDGTVIQTGDAVIYQLPFIIPAESAEVAEAYRGIGKSVSDLPFESVTTVGKTETIELRNNETTTAISTAIVVVGVSSLFLVLLFILL